MKEIILYKKYFLKIFLASKVLFKKTTGLIILIPSITISMLTNLQIALLVLLGAYVFDFATGILASWIEWKEIPNENKKGNLIQSRLMRKSLIKAVGYMVFILLVFCFNVLFFKKSINIQAMSNQGFTITELAVGFCIAIEGYSSVFENIKRAGFDLMSKFNNLINWINNIRKKLKGYENEENND